MALSSPEPLDGAHRLDDFDCGAPVLDQWLKRRARANQVSGASRTFVVCEDKRVVAYYGLASGAIDPSQATGRFRRNMPDPVPVAILARLAVDRRYAGRGLGRAMFRDACHRLASAADLLGIRGLIVHAMSEDARAFYAALGLSPSPLDPMTLMVTLADIRLNTSGP